MLTLWHTHTHMFSLVMLNKCASTPLHKCADVRKACCKVVRTAARALQFAMPLATPIAIWLASRNISQVGVVWPGLVHRFTSVVAGRGGLSVTGASTTCRSSLCAQ